MNHRAGPLKQANKVHKTGRHRSNRSISVNTKGKVGVKVSTRKNRDNETRVERRHREKQLRSTKRDDLLALKRKIGGSEDTPPLAVLLFSSSLAILRQLTGRMKACSEDVVVKESSIGFYMTITRFKTTYHIIPVSPSDGLYPLLDAAKVANVMVVAHAGSADSVHPSLHTLSSHSFPTLLHCFLPSTSKNKVAEKGQIKELVTCLPESPHSVQTIDSTSDTIQLMHLISSCKKKMNSISRFRSQVLAETFAVDKVKKTITFEGVVRGNPLNVNRLIHLTGVGDFQIESIEYKGKEKRGVYEGGRVAKPDPMVQESLEAENEIDEMEGEQTFPTAQEIADAAEEELKKKALIKKKVAKGTSDYQAAWIMDDEDNDEDGDNSEDEDDDQDEDMEDGDAFSAKEDEEDSDSEGEVAPSQADGAETDDMNEENYDEKIDLDENEKMRVRFAENEQFPDEMDTPMDSNARVRFARYRGLKSFNHTPWDPMENLPSDYSRIFQFQNFNRTKRRVLKDLVDEETDIGDHLFQVGNFVKVTLTNPAIFDTDLDLEKILTDRKIRLFTSLLKHEQRMTVMNVTIKKVPSCTEPIKSKERLIFHIGFRRFEVNPILSSHTNGDKFKCERFLRTDEPVVASFYAPVTFPPSSVLVFKEMDNGRQVLVATGSVLSVNPNRMVIKRIILSGHPFKIHKKSAVIRYMFFNKEDIHWFKPVELRTKYGRKGHIKEPLGTHGHMKCYFDRQISSMDTVLMNLYKRVFPKWTYSPALLDPKPVDEEDEEDPEMDTN